jgi:hypothetical protein
VIAVGARVFPGQADYCRGCRTITLHSFFCGSHETYLCHACGEEHEGEAWGWSCCRCGEESSAITKFVQMLARAGLEPEAA